MTECLANEMLCILAPTLSFKQPWRWYWMGADGLRYTQSKNKQTNKQTRAKPFCNINHMPHTGMTEVLHLLLKVCAGLKVTICHRNALQTWTSGHQSWKFEVTRQSKVVNCSFYSLLAQVYRAFSCLVTRDVSFSPHTWLTDFLHTIQKKMQIKVVFKTEQDFLSTVASTKLYEFYSDWSGREDQEP